MSSLTKLFTEVADDIPGEAASAAWGHSLHRTDSPYGAAFYDEEINLSYLDEKGSQLALVLGASFKLLSL